MNPNPKTDNVLVHTWRMKHALHHTPNDGTHYKWISYDTTKGRVEIIIRRDVIQVYYVVNANMSMQSPTNNTRKESDGILAIRLSKDVTKQRLDTVALGCQARSRNRLVNVLLKFGLDRLPKAITDIDILYRLLQEITAENPDVTKSVMNRLLLETSRLKEIDDTVTFLRKLQVYLSPPDQSPPAILEE